MKATVRIFPQRNFKNRILVLAVLMILTLIISACSPSSAMQTFTGSGVTLKYPGSWQPIDATKSSTCSQPGLECIVAIGTPADGTNLNLIRADAAGLALDTIDQQAWAQLSATPDIQLTSREAKQIAGQSAIERVYNQPSAAAPGGRAYVMQVYMIVNGKFYSFTGFATSSDAFAKHQQEIGDMIGSVQFAP
jgi:hypothetical protein